MCRICTLINCQNKCLILELNPSPEQLVTIAFTLKTMKKLRQFAFLFIAAFAFLSCKKESLSPAESVMVKFVNLSEKDISNLIVNRVELGDLNKGKSSNYASFDQLGQQYGYALVEAVADISHEKYYAAAACQGVCGTASAPDGTWLEQGYYTIGIKEDKPGNYLIFYLKQ